MIGLRLKLFPDLVDQVQAATLGGVALLIRTRWNARDARWRMDFSSSDDVLLIAGCALAPGVPLILPRRIPGMPQGQFLVEGPNPYRREDLGSALTVTFLATESRQIDHGYAVEVHQ